MITFTITDGKLLRSFYNPTIPQLPLNDYGGGKRVTSSRWNPTAEQLEALEEMYRRGTRTPSAEQIHNIAAKLTKFGKIEGKNVFYWFQNHKARDRQKKRRQFHDATLSGLSKRSRFKIEHPKELPTLSNCSTTPKCHESTHGAVDQELQKKYSDVKGRGPENENAPLVALNFWKMLGTKSDNFRDLGSGIKENKTLKLFPVKSSKDLSSVDDDDDDDDDDGSSCRFVPKQFFEFLPTKN